MRVLIVDDEKHVRQAIQLLANWEEYGVTEVLQASDGEEAVSLIQKHSPQIVMTDMRMPRKDGAALLTWLYEHAPEIKVIVISGYDDFELVRHVIRHGGMDYMLKPVQPDALNEVLEKAVSCWNKEEEGRRRMTKQRIQVNEMRPYYADRLFSDYLGGQGRKEQVLKQLEAEGLLPASNPLCTVAVLAIGQMDMRLYQKFKHQQELLYFTVMNIAKELLRGRGIVFRQLNHHAGEMVILYNGKPKALQALLQDLNEGVYLTLNRRFHAGISVPHAFPDEWADAYEEASNAVWQRNVLDPAYIHLKQQERFGSERSSKLSSLDEQLRLAALSGSEEQIGSAAALWINKLRERQSITPIELDQWQAELEWIIKQWMEEGQDGGANASEAAAAREEDAILSLNHEGGMDWELYEEQIVQKLQGISTQLIRKHSKDSFFVQDIAAYIERHYQEEISLQDIAAKFYLSREYIARKFKQAYGVTVLDYVSRYRIEKAKLLLHNPHLRIAQIAEMVGYQDEKYFSKVFKKVEGMNPGEYRKEHTLGI